MIVLGKHEDGVTASQNSIVYVLRLVCVTMQRPSAVSLVAKTIKLFSPNTGFTADLNTTSNISTSFVYRLLSFSK